MIDFQKNPNDRILELGGGSNRSSITDVNVDVRQVPGVDFTADFENLPLPIKDEDFDGLICRYCLEHLSFHIVPLFLKDCWRVIRPGAKVFFLAPNTEAQFQWIQKNPSGWDNKDLFVAASEVLFGSQDMEDDANSHKCYFSPTILAELFQKAGFEQIKVQPYNERGTDLLLEAIKPARQDKMEEIVKKVNKDIESQIYHGSSLTEKLRQDGLVEWSEEVELCGVKGPYGLTCIKPKGHAGNHAGQTT